MKKSQYGTDFVLEEGPLGGGSFILSVYDQVSFDRRPCWL